MARDLGLEVANTPSGDLEPGLRRGDRGCGGSGGHGFVGQDTTWRTGTFGSANGIPAP